MDLFPCARDRVTLSNDNGVVQKGSGATVVVPIRMEHGPYLCLQMLRSLVLFPGEVQLAAGQTAYAKTDKQADGTLTSHMILLIGGPPSSIPSDGRRLLSCI